MSSWKDRAKKVEDNWKTRAVPVEKDESSESPKFDVGLSDRSKEVPESKISGMESLARGTAQGVTMDFADEIIGGVKSIPSALDGLEALQREYILQRDLERERNRLAEEQHSGLYTTGNVVGGVSSMLIPGLNIAKAGKAAIGAGKLISKETGKAVLDVGAGALQNILPEKLVQAIGEDKPSREIANQVGQFYVNRYGSVEGAKKAIAEDPAGVLADISTSFSGDIFLFEDY